MRLADYCPGDCRSRPRSLAFTPVAALIAVGVLVSGCGGSGTSPGVAKVSTSSSSSSHTYSKSSTDNGGGGQTALTGGGPLSGPGGNAPNAPVSLGFAVQTGNQRQGLKFSECMRANGVPNYPDPNGQGVIEGNSSEGLDPNSPAFQNASKACVKDLHRVAPSPAQIAERQAGALSFSKCMRSHGVTNFPDPQFGSGGLIRIGFSGKPGSGLDINSPIFQKAQKDCGSLLLKPPP